MVHNFTQLFFNKFVLCNVRMCKKCTTSRLSVPPILPVIKSHCKKRNSCQVFRSMPKPHVKNRSFHSSTSFLCSHKPPTIFRERWHSASCLTSDVRCYSSPPPLLLLRFQNRISYRRVLLTSSLALQRHGRDIGTLGIEPKTLRI